VRARDSFLVVDFPPPLPPSLSHAPFPPTPFAGVAEPKIGTAIQDGLGLPCKSNDTVQEMIRGIRFHFPHYVKDLSATGATVERAQLGLAHSYSRAKVKFNVNKADNMIIQAIALLDQLDKDLNTFAMRVREWYSWHFPELAKIVKDNTMYARCAQVIGSRTTLNEERLPEVTAITMDEDLSAQILDASRTSMGMDISDMDLANVGHFTARLISLSQYRLHLSEYLHVSWEPGVGKGGDGGGGDEKRPPLSPHHFLPSRFPPSPSPPPRAQNKMGIVAPNLSALIGDTVGARLISHAGSLTNLAKAPASTVQILGAEKALFRALKTKGNTPKYGLIFHSSFIGRAAAKNKGRISRYLANKCSIAARIDSFSEKTTTKFGEKLREQVEERLAFYESGAAPKRNADVMHGVVEELRLEEEGEEGGAGAGASSARKGKGKGGDEDGDAAMSGKKSGKKDKSEKKEKKSKRAADEDDEDGAARSSSKKSKKAARADSDDDL
jgi:nucleolar protein 56